MEVLPLIFVDGKIHLKGRYLTDEERETLTRSVLSEKVVVTP